MTAAARRRREGTIASDGPARTRGAVAHASAAGEAISGAKRIRWPRPHGRRCGVLAAGSVAIATERRPSVAPLAQDHQPQSAPHDPRAVRPALATDLAGERSHVENPRSMCADELIDTTADVGIETVVEEDMRARPGDREHARGIAYDAGSGMVAVD